VTPRSGWTAGQVVAVVGLLFVLVIIGLAVLVS
jgi:hypothetical protein